MTEANPSPASTDGSTPPDWLELIFIGIKGYVVALNKFSGAEVWRQSLVGAGFNLVTLLVEDGVLYAASHGYLFALHPATGEVFWRNDLKGLGHNMIAMATARQSTTPHDNPLLQAKIQAMQQAATTTIPGT